MTELQALKIQHALANDMVISLENTDTLGEAGMTQLRAAERERNRLATLIEAHEKPDLVSVLNRIGRKAQLMQHSGRTAADCADAFEIELLAGIALKMVGAAQ
jgi:hypothetical protein